MSVSMSSLLFTYKKLQAGQNGTLWTHPVTSKKTCKNFQLSNVKADSFPYKIVFFLNVSTIFCY